jgi:DnaK suppressor protein
VRHDGLVEDVRRRLAVDREQALVRLAGLTADHDAVVAASLDTNADDEHDPEGTTIAFERSQIGALVRQVRHHLAEVDAALARVEAGSYGVCERCGSPIGDARLEALPAARLCIGCAARVSR